VFKCTDTVNNVDRNNLDKLYSAYTRYGNFDLRHHPTLLYYALSRHLVFVHCRSNKQSTEKVHMVHMVYRTRCNILQTQELQS